MFDIKRKFSQSIKFRSYVIIATTVTLVQLISTISLIIFNFNNLKDSFTQRIELIASFQADALSEALWQYDEHIIEAILESFEKSPIIIYAAIYDNNGKVMYSNGDNTKTNKILVSIKPIIYQGNNQFLGKIQLNASLAELYNQLWHNIFIGIVKFIIMQIFILGAMYWVFRDTIDPIQRITNIVHLIKDGSLENEIPDIHRQDEIGAIANAVNSLQSYTKGINDYRKQRELEKEERQNKISSLIEEFYANSSNVIKSVEHSSQ